MAAFNTNKTLNGSVSLIPEIANRIENDFIREGYEVQKIALSSGGYDISITKGGLFKAVLGMKTALKVTLLPQGGNIYFESSLYQWLKVIAIRHCMKLKSQAKVIENESKEPLNNRVKSSLSTECSLANMDLDSLLGKMKNQRYAMVIRLLMIDGLTPEDVASQLSITVANLYNIKRRAIVALTEVALKDKKHYER